MMFGLEGLPSEIIALVGKNLDRPSLLSLRLTSKSCKSTFAHPFSRLFETQTIHLTRVGLQKLSDVASAPDTSRGVRNLHFICVYYHVESRTHINFRGRTSPIRGQSMPGPSGKADPLVETWIGEQLQHQASFSGKEMHDQITKTLCKLRHRLDAITLNAKVFVGPGQCVGPEDVHNLTWRRLWARAIQAYRILVSAIACAQVSFSSLSLYSQTLKCSLPTNEFAAPLARLDKEGFLVVAKGLKCFSVSLATTTPFSRPTGTNAQLLDDFFGLPDDSPTPHQIPDSELDAKADFDGMATLIRSMTNLESLDVHLFRPLGSFVIDTTPSTPPFEPLLRTVMRDNGFPRLTRLRLRGMPASRKTLLHCLSQHQRLQFLSLGTIFLTGGDSWSHGIFPSIAGAPSITRVHLSDLWQHEVSRWNVLPPTLLGQYGLVPGSAVWRVQGPDHGESEGERAIDVEYDPGYSRVGVQTGSSNDAYWKWRTEFGHLGSF